MELIFLGTSSGVPTKARNVTGLALLEGQGNGWYLVDCGEGTQHQLLRTPLSPAGLRAVFITHVHGDHCYGLPGLLASAGMSGRREPLTIIAPSGIREWLESTQRQTQLQLPFDLEFVCSDDLPVLNFAALAIGVTKLSHRAPSFAYCFAERRVEGRLDVDKLTAAGVPKGPLWGQISKGIDVNVGGRVVHSGDFITRDRRPRKVVVSGDNDRPELLRDTAADCNVLVHEATYTKEVAQKVGPGVGHSCAEQVAAFAETSAVPNLILTHFSPRYQAHSDAPHSIADIYAEAASVYSGNLHLAEDFARFRLGKTGSLLRVALR